MVLHGVGEDLIVRRGRAAWAGKLSSDDEIVLPGQVAGHRAVAAGMLVVAVDAAAVVEIGAVAADTVL